MFYTVMATGAGRGRTLDSQLRTLFPLLSIAFFNSWLDMCGIWTDHVLNLLMCGFFFFLSNKNLCILKPVNSILSCSTETFLCITKYIYYNSNSSLTSGIEMWNREIHIGIWDVVPWENTYLVCTRPWVPPPKKKGLFQSVPLLFGPPHSLTFCTLLKIFLNSKDSSAWFGSL